MQHKDVFGRNIFIFDVIAIIDHLYIQSMAVIVDIVDYQIFVKYFDNNLELLETEYPVKDTSLNCILLQTPNKCKNIKISHIGKNFDINWLDCNKIQLYVYDFVLVRGCIGLIVDNLNNSPVIKLFQDNTLTKALYKYPILEIQKIKFEYVSKLYKQLRIVEMANNK